MKDKAAKNEGEVVMTPLAEDEEAINRLQEIINRYYKMNIKCDLILYKINKIRKAQQPV